MSKYTTELRFICESLNNLDYPATYKDTDKIILTARPLIFDFDYPIFDSSYRPIIETKIIRHYYFDEIGVETYGQWKFWLQTTLNEIMPYYNELYKSALLNFDPFNNYNITETFTKNTDEETDNKRNEIKFNNQNSDVTAIDVTELKTNTTENNNSTAKGDSTQNKTTSNTGKTDNTNSSTSDTTTSVNQNGATNQTNTKLYSDTPQGSVNGILDENYLTNATSVADSKIDNQKTSSNTHASNNGTTTENITENGTETNSANENKTITDSKSKNENSNNTNSKTQSLKSNNNQTSSNNDNGTLNRTENYAKILTGKTNFITNSKALIEFRDTFINIDMLVIHELSQLFMGVY